MVDNITAFIKNNIKDKSLDTIKIYCRNKQKEGTQIILDFYKKYNFMSFFNMRIYSIKNYVKTCEEFKTISHFGKLENILTTLLYNELNLAFSNGKKYFLIIGIGINESILPETLEIIYDKTDKNFNSNECPVCKIEWNDREYVKLPCDHIICRDCMLSLVFHNKYKREINCPVCRKDMLEGIRLNY